MCIFAKLCFFSFKTDFELFCFLKEQKNTLNILVCRKSDNNLCEWFLSREQNVGGEATEKTEDESQGKRMS